MVVGVMEKQRVHHFFNRCLTTRASIAVTVGKFELATAANDLVPFIGCHHPVTLATADEAGEGKFVTRLRAGSSFSAKQYLYPIIFRLRDHRLVLSLIPLAAAGRVFKPTVIERLGENLVDAASGQRFAAHAPGWSCAKAPFSVSHFQNFWWCVEAGQHLFPHSTNERKTLRVFDKRVLTCQLVRVV